MGSIYIPIVTGALKLKGPIDASGNPNYPAGTVDDYYVVTVAGKVGGASGVSVSVSDLVICQTTNAGGTQAAVGSSWFILDLSATALVPANNLSDVANLQTSLTNLTTGATQINHAGLAQALSTGGFLWDKNNNEFSDGLRIGDIINGSWFDFADGTLWVKSTQVIDASGNGIFASVKIGGYVSLTTNAINFPSSSTDEMVDSVGYYYYKNGNLMAGNTGDLRYYSGGVMADTNGNILYFSNSAVCIGADGSIHYQNGDPLIDSSGNLYAVGSKMIFSTSGIYVGDAIDYQKGGTGNIGGAGIVKTDGNGTQSIAGNGTDYLSPSGNGGALTGITASQVSGVSLLPIVTNSSPTTGQTVSTGTAKLDETLYITPAGTLLALTITLPTAANSRVGQIVRGFISQIITGLTVNEAGSGTVVGSTPITSSVNSYFAYQCFSVAGNGLWGRIN